VSWPTFSLFQISNIFVFILNYCLCLALFRESVKRPWRDVKNMLNSLQTLCNWKDFHGLMHLSMLTAERYVDFFFFFFGLCFWIGPARDSQCHLVV
jgi:hypothetical protein